MDVTRYIIESCEIQQATTPADFVGMTIAYHWAFEEFYMNRTSYRPHSKHIYLSDLSALICPIKNTSWVPWRSQPAMFANGNIALDAEFIPRQIKLLLEHQDELDPDEFYFQFEQIHPWPDGNGRVGSLLWNVKTGTISDPRHPPHNLDWEVQF